MTELSLVRVARESESVEEQPEGGREGGRNSLGETYSRTCESSPVKVSLANCCGSGGENGCWRLAGSEDGMGRGEVRVAASSLLTIHRQCRRQTEMPWWELKG